MKRTFTILLALMTIVPTIVPAVAQQPDPEPGDPLPEDPAPEDPLPEDPEPGEPGPEDPAPDEPPEEAPDELPEEVPDPPEEAPEELPDAPRGPDASSTATPRAAYFEEDFSDLGGFAQVELDGDRNDEPIWHVEPVGHNDSSAAVLSTSEGLPRGLHQGLASPTIDLTPVPSMVQDPTVTSATDAGIERANRAAQEAIRTGAVSGEATSQSNLAQLTQNPVLETGPISLPNGPATLSLLHSFNFDDTRNEDGEAVSGFSIEARSAGGDWVPVEATMLARPAHDADIPGPRSQVEEGTATGQEDVSVCQPQRVAASLLDTAVASTPLPGDEFNDEALPNPVECDQGTISTDISPDVGQLMLDVGDASFQVSTSPANNESEPGDEGTPILPNAQIQPLDQRGFTGHSDTDDDGEYDTVAHSFDLSPWAGDEVELRFRAGTSAVTEVPGGFWALDHAEVRAAASTADLRVNLTSPSLDHEAPPERALDDRDLDEQFPVRAEVQNVGFTGQSGPFEVEFTITQAGKAPITETVQAPADSLSFLETTTAQFNLTALGSAPYQIEASIASTHPDERPMNDADADILPVGVDESADIDVQPESPIAEPGELFSTTVVVEPESNVPLDQDLTLTAFPYDPTTQLPIGDGAVVLGEDRIQLPRSADKHPAGVEGAVQTVDITRTLPEGAYLLVAEMGDSTAQAPLGVGSPPPPVLSEGFDEIEAGPESFALETGAGEWTVRPDSDVSPVPRVLDPGSVTNGSAWIPLSHESTLLRPQAGENYAQGFQDLPDPNPGSGGCPAAAVDIVLGIAGQDCESATEGVSAGQSAGTPIVLESPQGTQRVHGMATEVPLHDASQAELEYISSLLPPKDASGVSEARVYVATDQDTQSLVSQASDPENCPQASDAIGQLPDQEVPGEDLIAAPTDPCEIANIIAFDQTADVLVQSLFALEENVRCAVPNALDDTVEGGGATVTDVTCPSGTEEAETCTGAGQNVGDGNLCMPAEPTQIAALAPLLSGTLVERHEDPHTWERSTIDLDPWAGQNVTVGIVYIGESHEATQTYDVQPYGSVADTDLRGETVTTATDPLSGTIGYEAPGQSKGAFMASRIQVQSDAGIKLGPEETQRIANQAVNTAQSSRPGYADVGWNTVGYDHVSGLGDAETPLRTSAQLLTGSGDPVAEGADASDGLQLGTRDDTGVGVELFPRRLHADATEGSGQTPGELHANADDPAVTVLSSPTLDLAGNENPLLRFDQKFDLETDHGPQGMSEPIDHDDIAASLDLPSNVTGSEECGLGDRNNALNEDAATIEGLRCLLEEKRNQDPEFNVQNDVLRTSVAEPGVSAGLYVQARTITDGGVSEPRLVEPVDGYRYPVEDPGAFQPTLDYTVHSPDSFPGYTLDQEPIFGAEAGAFEQPTFRESRTPSFAGTPAWAGDSDVDGDDEADWVTSQLDLRPWAGQEIQLEFVLVGRQNQTVGDPSDPQQDGRLLTDEPWSIDGIEVVEGEVEGEVELAELRWPTEDLPVVTPGEDLPVRATVTTPTGLDEPVHGKAVLVDGEGCVRGSAHVQTQFENEAGRVEPMPAGAELELPDMIIDGENVDGTTPWDVLVGVDVGQEPDVLAPSSVETRPIDGDVSRLASTGALNVSEGATIDMLAQDPNCEPAVDILTVVPQGAQPVVEKEEENDRELRFEVLTGDDKEEDEPCEGDELQGDARRSFEVNGACAPVLLSVSESQGADAGGTSVLLSSDHTAEERTARVEAPSERIPVGSPVEVTIDVPHDLDEAHLWTVDPSAPSPDPERIWQGTSIGATEELALPVTLEDAGPTMLVLTGTSEDHASTIGGTFVVASDATSAGDPTELDNRAEITTIAGERQQLTVEDVTVTPSTGLSTTPRTVEATVQNTGTTTLHGIAVAFQAEGSAIAEKTRDVLRAGETATFTLPEFNTGGEPSVVIRVDASTEEGLTATNAAPARSLVELGSLTPLASDDSDGWEVSGEEASFRDPETGEAPQDTTGTVDLVREAHRPEEGARMEGLAGVAVQLDHTLDMEERFDGGQVILSNESETRTLSVGDATEEMGPYSPISGEALTGVRDRSDETVELDTADAETERLVDDTAIDALGYPLLTDDSGDPEDSAEDAEWVDCERRTFSDERVDPDSETGAYCEHAEPAVPAPSTAASQGIFHLQPASFLSSQGTWTVDTDDGPEYDVTVNEATSYVFLEGGRDLVASAQEAGKLEIRFDESRVLDPRFDAQERPLSVEVCARFMQVTEDDGVDVAPELPTVRRCTGLNHDEADDQLLEQPWSTTILSIGDIPEGPDSIDDPYNVVRLELSLQQDREALRETGLMGQGQDSNDAWSLQEPVKGWFVGPVSAVAGDTEETWTPDERALTATDPNTGVDASTLEGAIEDNDGMNPGGIRLADQIEQFGLVGLTDVEVVETDGATETTHQLSTVNGIEALEAFGEPSYDVPLTPCAWHQTDGCDWTDIFDAYTDSNWANGPERLRVLASAPYAMNLTCELPTTGLFDPEDGIDEEGISGTSGCEETSSHTPGMGVQVLDTSSITDGADSPCGDDEVGPPVLWRTRCLYAQRADPNGDEDPEVDPTGESMIFSNTDDVSSENPLRSRGHSVDYRLVVPVDLRFAADDAQAFAQPDFEELGNSDGGNSDLPVNLLTQARIQGEDTWQDVPQCRDVELEDCSRGWQPIDDSAVTGDRIDLTGFVGQQIELAFRIQLPHPALEEGSDHEPSFALHGVTVDAGYLRLIDIGMQLRAWTDPSIQGEGWDVRGVELFGLPIKANVGINELDSKMQIGESLHVHTDEAAKQDVFMSVPANLTVYNQGVDSQTLPLEASLEARNGTGDWHYSTSNAWEDDGDGDINAQGTCDVQIEPEEVDLEPGQSERVEARVSFVPADADGVPNPKDGPERTLLGECFPGQFDDDPDDPDSLDPVESELDFRMNVNVSEVPEDDYVASDDTLTQPLRPAPFLEHGFDDETHAAELAITSFDIDPTRPAPGQPVRVSADVSLRDLNDRGADIELEFVDPATNDVLRTLSGTDADTPTTTFEPYQTTTLNWTLPSTADFDTDELIVRLSAEITRDARIVEDDDQAWLAGDSVEEHVRWFAADDSELNTAGDAEPMFQGDGQLVVTTDQGGSDDGPNQPQSPSTPAPVPGGGEGGQGDELQGAAGTDWMELDGSPPPLVGVNARWSFDGTDRSGAEGDQVADGWAIQVCTVSGEPDNGDCPISVQTAGESSTHGAWAWRTADIVRAPADTLAEVADPGDFGAPGDCSDQSTNQMLPEPVRPDSANQCSAISAQWANMHEGSDIVTGTSPGYSLDLDEEGALRTVVADATSCYAEDDEDVYCPLDWGDTSSSTDRHDHLRVRIVALGADDTQTQDLTLTDVTMAPVGIGGEQQNSTAGFPIPEEAPKAIPMNVQTLGEIGTKVDTSVNEPDGWDVRIEDLPATNAIEDDTEPRLLVEAPISPSGISQSAVIGPQFNVQAEPLRSIETLVPVGVQAGQHPDLVVQDVELTDEVKQDDEALVQVRVENVGFETSEEVEVTGVARYDDGQVNLLEPPKDQDSVTLPELPPGVEETVVLTWTPTDAGNATVRVGADLTRAEPLSGPVVSPWGGGEMPELKECSDPGCNNVGTQRTDVVPPREADTSVDVEVLADPPLVVGEPVEVEVTVENAGPATVPAYEVRLLAGVVSLLEDDPLRVTDPLAPGESWSTTVQMIPGFGGDLDLVGQVSSDESLVRELRGLQPGGGTYDEDNVDNRRIPVVARGLSIDVPRAVTGETIADNGSLEVPVTLANLGSEALDVSAAAKTERGIGTLVDDAGDPIGTVSLDPGAAENATLLLLYDQLPTAGRQPVTIDAVSEAGVESGSLDVEVPARTGADVRPVVETASAGKVQLPVNISATGNAPTQAQIAVNAPGLSPASQSLELEPGNTTEVQLPTWLDASTESTVEGEIVVRSDTFTQKAPLRIVQEGDVMPTIENAKAVGGTSPHTWAHVANLGTTAGSFELALVQDDETLATETVRVDGRSTENVTLDALPDPGPARIQLESPATDSRFNWTMAVDDLQPDISVLHTRLDPAAPEGGETVEVQATIANDGGSAVDLRPGLFVDGVLHTVSSQERTVEPGGVTSVAFEWVAEDGEHTLSVSADPQDRIEDVDASDDAMAREVAIQSGATGGPLAVPFLPMGPAAAIALLAAAAWLRRDRSG